MGAENYGTFYKLAGLPDFEGQARLFLCLFVTMSG